jgi:hypothetical protein
MRRNALEFLHGGVTQFFLTRLIVYEFLRYAEFLFAENSPNKHLRGKAAAADMIDHIEFVLTKSRISRHPPFLGFRGHIQSVLLDIRNKIFCPPNAPNISQISKLPMTMVMIMSSTTTDTQHPIHIIEWNKYPGQQPHIVL